MNCHQGYQGHQGYHQGGHQGHQGGHQGHQGGHQAHQSTHQQPLMQVPVAPAPQGGPKCGNMGMPHSSLGMHMGQVQSVAAAGAAAVSQAMRDAARPENKGNKFYATYDNSGDRPSLRDRAHFVPPLSMEDVETEAPPRVPWKPPSPAAGSLRSRRDHFEASGISVDDMNLPGVPSTPLPLMPATPDTPGFPKWNRVTQTPEALRAYSPMPIHNTFINYPMPPPTPNPCQGRSQSLPRNLSRMEDEGLDWSKSDTLSSHPANRLMSAAAAAAGPAGPGPKAPHPISTPGCTQPGVSNSPGFHPQNYTNPGASTIRLADLLWSQLRKSRSSRGESAWELNRFSGWSWCGRAFIPWRSKVTPCSWRDVRSLRDSSSSPKLVIRILLKKLCVFFEWKNSWKVQHNQALATFFNGNWKTQVENTGDSARSRSFGRESCRYRRQHVIRRSLGRCQRAKHEFTCRTTEKNQQKNCSNFFSNKKNDNWQAS